MLIKQIKVSCSTSPLFRGIGGVFCHQNEESSEIAAVFNPDTTGLNLDEPTEEQEESSVSHRLRMD